MPVKIPQTLPARAVAYDTATGFGLIRPLLPLRGVSPVPLGSLQELWLSFNQLSGAIPAELGQLAELTILRLNNNLLIEDVPDSLLDLVHLMDPGDGWDGKNKILLEGKLEGSTTALKPAQGKRKYLAQSPQEFSATSTFPPKLNQPKSG